MLYFKYLAMNLRALLEYRLSTALGALGQFFTAFSWFLSISLLFRRFGAVAGWSFAEAGLCFAVTNIAFSLSECFARGFDAFSGMVIRGDFDRVLLRPRSTIIQVLGARIEITRMGRLIQALVVLFIVIPRAGIAWSTGKILTLVLMILGGAALFTGIFILGAAVCFFTLEGLEIVNIFTDGGRELASYPLPVYGRRIRRFFTFVIPFGCVNYLPLMYLTGRAGSHPLLSMLAPLAGPVFLLPCLAVWRAGVRRYTSSGS
ncbi:MAG: ABC-2 family transporter protein [Treponema sp.]|jgi:ABC-2 type transport system permease protein|nr:ABC-2 family transporter protein [Treponema sp.]